MHDAWHSLKGEPPLGFPFRYAELCSACYPFDAADRERVMVHWEYMKVVALYRPNSEFARQVEEFVRDMQRQHGVDERHIEMLDYDSREGAAMASLYDVMTQPTILVIGDDGSYVKSWEGTNLPLMQEVSGYVFSYH